MERLEYASELSALWHFALDATHMLMKTHLSNPILDPTRLAAHKAVLHRVWDVNKPNYAKAKSLIRHLLITHLLDAVMYSIFLSYYPKITNNFYVPLGSSRDGNITPTFQNGDLH